MIAVKPRSRVLRNDTAHASVVGPRDAGDGRSADSSALFVNVELEVGAVVFVFVF